MTQTIEATGKIWKAAQAIGVLLVVVGATWFFIAAGLESGGGAAAGAAIGGIGLAGYLTGRVGAWWFHG